MHKIKVKSPKKPTPKKRAADTSASTTPTLEPPVAAAKDPDFGREVQVSRKSTGEKQKQTPPNTKATGKVRNLQNMFAMDEESSPSAKSKKKFRCQVAKMF
jgi:hypothetical protein